MRQILLSLLIQFLEMQTYYRKLYVCYDKYIKWIFTLFGQRPFFDPNIFLHFISLNLYNPYFYLIFININMNWHLSIKQNFFFQTVKKIIRFQSKLLLFKFTKIWIDGFCEKIILTALRAPFVHFSSVVNYSTIYKGELSFNLQCGGIDFWCLFLLILLFWIQCSQSDRFKWGVNWADWI